MGKAKLKRVLVGPYIRLCRGLWASYVPFVGVYEFVGCYTGSVSSVFGARSDREFAE